MTPAGNPFAGHAARLNHASAVIGPVIRKLAAPPKSRDAVLPLKLAAPSILPVVAVALMLLPLLAFAVESTTLNVFPLGKCHTPLKFASTLRSCSVDWKPKGCHRT